MICINLQRFSKPSHNLINHFLVANLVQSMFYISFLQKNSAEHSVETKDEIVHKLEEFMIPLHYYLEKADVRRVHFIFKNAKTDDELYSFKFPVIFTYRKCSGLKEYNLYHDTELSQAYRLEY